MNNLVKALIAAGILVPIIIGIFFWTVERGNEAERSRVPSLTSGDEPPEPQESRTPVVEQPTIKVDLRGVARLAEGRRLSGVQIVAISATGDSTTAESRGTSDEQGRFTLPGLAPGKYQVRGSHAGYQDARASVTLFEGDNNPQVELVFVSGLAISGHVRDVAGTGVANASVTAFLERTEEGGTIFDNIKVLIEIQEIENDRGITATTDQTGWYQITGLEAAKYRLDAVARTFAPGTTRFVEAGRTDADFVLEPSGILSGRVVGSEAGPLEGAIVAVYRQATKQKDVIEEILTRLRPPLASRETDSNGQFIFDELGGGDTYRLVAQAEGHQPSQVDKVVVNLGENSPLEITLGAGAVITGVVLDPDLRPLEGARVKCNIQGGRPKVQITILDKGILTDENGEFAFNTLEEGSDYRIVVSHEKYASFQQNRIKPSDTDTLTVTLKRGGAIEGTITDSMEGHPITGAIVRVRDIADVEKTGVTDKSGKYYIGGLTQQAKSRTTSLSVEAEGYARLANQSIKVEDGAVLGGHDFSLDRNGSVAGIVMDAQGNPVPGCEVTVKRQHSPNVPVVINVAETTVADGQGRFRLNNVAPGTESFLYGSHRDYLESESDRFELGAGESLANLELRLRVGGVIDGKVTNANGLPIAGALVGVREDHLNNIEIHALGRRATTDAEGNFRFSSMEAGSHTLLAEADGFLRVEYSGVQVDEGLTTTGVRITLIQGASLSGHVMDTSGGPLRGATVTYVDTSDGLKKQSTRTDSNGAYAFNDLGREAVRVEAELSGYTKVVRYDVPVDSVDVDFQLEMLGSLRGFVVNERREPVRAFSVNPTLIQDGRELKTKFPARTFSNSDGSYLYKDVDPGTYKVVFGAPGFGPSILEGVVVSPDSETVVGEVVLTEGGKISGYVLDSDTGSPVASAHVNVLSAKFVATAVGVAPNTGGLRKRQGTVVTDRNGYFEVIGLASTRATLKVQHRGYIDTTLSDVTAGSRDLQIFLDPGGTIEGQVYGPDGTPERGRQILLTGGGVNDRKVSDRKGFYRFTGLPGGVYTLRLTQLGITKERVNVLNAPTYEVQIAEGQSQTFDIHLSQ